MTGARAATAALLLLPACGSGGCWVDGPPDSPPLAVGEQTTVDATVQDGVLGFVDVDGGYQLVQGPGATGRSLRVALEDGEHRLTARRTPEQLELRVEGRWIALEGPIGCD